jgi:hypothetical protein
LKVLCSGSHTAEIIRGIATAALIRGSGTQLEFPLSRYFTTCTRSTTMVADDRRVGRRAGWASSLPSQQVPAASLLLALLATAGEPRALHLEVVVYRPPPHARRWLSSMWWRSAPAARPAALRLNPDPPPSESSHPRSSQASTRAWAQSRRTTLARLQHGSATARSCRRHPHRVAEAAISAPSAAWGQ